MTSVSAIISEFVSNVDTDKEYGLAEFKAILSTAYKTVKAANAPAKASKTVKKERVKRERDADGNIIKKRAPSAYNLFVKDKIAEIKKENPDLNSKDAFKKAIEAWNKQKADKEAESVNEEEDNE